MVSILACCRAGAPLGIESPILRMSTPSWRCFLITCHAPAPVSAAVHQVPLILVLAVAGAVLDHLYYHDCASMQLYRQTLTLCCSGHRAGA